MSYKKSGRCTAGRINRFDTELCGRRISLYSAEGNEPEGLGGKHRQKKETQMRNREIYRRYREGVPVSHLSEDYYLSPKSIQKIIARCREGSA